PSLPAHRYTSRLAGLANRPFHQCLRRSTAAIRTHVRARCTPTRRKGPGVSPDPFRPAETQQVPLSAHTSWPLLPGTSPWVHHFAVHLWPPKETTEPPT